MRKPSQPLLPSPVASVTAGVTVGRLLPSSTPERLLVDFPGNAATDLCARSTLEFSTERLQQALERAQPAVLLFEGGDPTLPILVGMIEAPKSPFEALLGSSNGVREELAQDHVLESGAEAEPDGFQVATAPLSHLVNPFGGDPSVAAEVGKRLTISAGDELVLECGKASITLRRNGRVVVRGTHIETDSDGPNRIKGGHVRIN